jgi:RNA recognition motif-containing protein
MDNFDLATVGGSGNLTVLEYQGRKNLGPKKFFNNIYVKGFPCEDFEESDLMELFKEFGEIQNAVIMRDCDEKSKGFGFVCFSDPSSAEQATTAVNSKADSQEDGDEKEVKEVKGVKLSDLYVREAKKKNERVKEALQNNFKFKKSIMMFTLFVKNFPVGVSEQDLKAFFNQSANGQEVVQKIRFIPGTQQAFINFDKQEHCKNARDFARCNLFNSQFALYAEFCYPKEMRQIKLEEIQDRKAQERKKQQQNQAIISQFNGTQNLIDLLRAILQPAVNLQGQSHRRSHSTNYYNQRQPMAPQMMAQPQLQNQRGYVNQRSNFQGPDRG